MKQEKSILNIKAEGKLGLIHSVAGMIEKRQIEIKSLNAAPTDIHDIILITVEVMGDEAGLTSLALKLENIVEVFSVTISRCDEVICLRAAYFKINKTFLETNQLNVFQKHNAVIVNWEADYFLAAKYGTDVSIQSLYNELEGPHLLGFSQTGLISDKALMEDAEGRVIGECVINRLAA